MNEACTPTQASLDSYRNAQAWYGPQLDKHPEYWVHQLTGPELAQLDQAVRRADAGGKDITELTRDDFELGGLGQRLQHIKHEVLHGRGLYLIRGVPVEQYTMRQSAIAFWALGTSLGLPVSQNGKGHVLGHVANLGLDYADAAVRGYQTSNRLPYHTDSSDIVGLLCVRPAKSGGLSSVVSSTTVWNELAARHPEHARTLLDSFHRTRWGEIPQGQKPYSSSPIFAPWQGRMYANYVRSAIRKAQALPSVPRLTPQQNEALDCLDALACDPALYLDMDFKPGDVQFLSNFTILHSRTAYEDWPETERRRHLLRLWLACEGGPPIPEPLLRRNGLASNGRPNGIEVPGVKPNAPLVPQ
ncbi:TauD/TfdA family dioxygenase [Bordetella bronchiseptica]|uniref:TauD/TfdA-like domain-containing protein n=1 Tax=Bordetella genomosp. 6 TaxID=463024 RepID=A0ABX4FM85_9BORD|nr:TauD/TfdA family dioxygenase [Bordetella genomosp. 6]MBN3266051.1 hypothetical protein [Bordetella bronchiseptica]OZI81392.1 hypothetical protein CAL23_06665 [Bordetella genomosp. 6]